MPVPLELADPRVRYEPDPVAGVTPARAGAAGDVALRGTGGTGWGEAVGLTLAAG